MIPLIGETVEYRERLYVVKGRQCRGVFGWWLTLTSCDDGHETSARLCNVTRIPAAAPVIDNVIPMPRRAGHLYLATVNGEYVG